MTPEPDRPKPPDDCDDDVSQETARLRLEDELAALQSNGVAQQQPANPALSQMKIKSRPVPGSQPKGVDITAHFTAACSALETGQLVKDEFFTLFESVGALEIMDPKMDSGFLAPGETLEEDYDVQKDLLPEEVLGIMDQLFCYEMAWHQGYPLSQTLFISVHIDRVLYPEPRELADSFFSRRDRRTGRLLDPDPFPPGKPRMHYVLWAYILGLIKYCDNVVQRVTSRDYFEEEDFSTHTYVRQLLTRFSEQEIGDILAQVTQSLQSEWQQDGELNASKEVVDALVSRLELRTALLQVTSPEIPLDQTQDGWNDVADIIRKVEETHSLGRPVKEAFSSKIQRRLASTVPPRPVVELDFALACRILNELCQDNLEVVRGTQLQKIGPQEILTFIWAFNSRKPQPLAYSRACLSNLVFGNADEMYEELIRRDIADLTLCNDPILDPVNWTIELSPNPLIPSDNRAVMAEIINTFTAKAVPAFLDFWTSLCQNRCRTRRLLCHNLITFHNLQLDTEVLDQRLHAISTGCLQYPLTSWAYHQKLRIMEWVVQLGFEQDIYLPDEYAGMYFWLSTISSERANLLQRILSSIREQHATVLDTPSTAPPCLLSTITAIESALYTARATAALAEALSDIYQLLLYLRAVPLPTRPFGSAALRFELRMKPFLGIDTPQLPLPDKFEEEIQPFGPWNWWDAPASADAAAAAAAASQHEGAEDNVDGEEASTVNNGLTRPLSDICDLLSRDIAKLIPSAKAHFTAAKELGPTAARAESAAQCWEREHVASMRACVRVGLLGDQLGKLGKRGEEGVKELAGRSGVRVVFGGEEKHGVGEEKEKGKSEAQDVGSAWCRVPKVEIEPAAAA
ncbi:Mak10 subunit, NatC N-terminal acetyltransferase-domain-containing protein [Phyllosticta capitalensis]|uniref:Mak10 subunit, NatC N-terminal acetyltransferase-domain-containing protein n=1 Tax=Phyllosticta capitalensis TaxID=121624 RepID=UPI00312EB10C